MTEIGMRLSHGTIANELFMLVEIRRCARETMRFLSSPA